MQYAVFAAVVFSSLLTVLPALHDHAPFTPDAGEPFLVDSAGTASICTVCALSRSLGQTRIEETVQAFRLEPLHFQYCGETVLFSRPVPARAIPRAPPVFDSSRTL